MARGRFINKSMNENARLEAMLIECVDFFKRVVSISDVEGRLKGDSKYLRNILYPWRESIRTRHVEGLLKVLWNSKDDDNGFGLIERYSVNGKECIWLPGFDKHQKGIRKDREAASEIPPCPLETTPVSAAEITSVKEVREDIDAKLAAMIKYYEEEIGHPLTPMDYENIKDFAATYPDGWFEKAVDEAKKRKVKAPIRYIEKCMLNWQQEEEPPEVSTNNQGFEVIQ